jgi:hypothetical protein
MLLRIVQLLKFKSSPLRIVNSYYSGATLVRFLSAPSLLPSREELNRVEEWRKGFTVEDLPKDKFMARFSRSSGPGGQNVNKGL